jgi:hypothetical protein
LVLDSDKNGPMDISFKQVDSTKIPELENYVQKRRRKTQDNRLCSRAFVQDGKTYFDCTKARTPTGDINTAEWCYVEPHYKDTRNWGFCIPILDFNKIRGTNMQSLKNLTKEINSVNKDIAFNITPAQRSYESLKTVKTNQEKLIANIAELGQKITNIDETINKLIKTKDQCDIQERYEKELIFKIETKQKDVKAQKEEEEKNPALTLKTTDCKDLLLYEDLEDGDGLIGYYYNNENWLGSPKEVKQKEINFDWTDTVPLKDINPNNFSVKWEGWIVPPATGNYVFYTECDDGALLSIDDEYIIQHKQSSLVNNYIQLMSTGDKSNSLKDFNKSQSKPIYLIGGITVKVVFKYFHSVHTSIFNSGQAFVKLSWSNEDFKETIIPNKYLMTSYEQNALKITNYDTNEAQLRKLKENDSAFNNSDRYILQDIPFEFLNSSMFKLKTRYMKDSIDFNISVDGYIYIGVLSHYPNPLTYDFEYTGNNISLLQLEKSQAKSIKRLYANKSGQLVLYRKRIDKGYVKINFNKIGINAKGIPMIVFFTFDSKMKKPPICSGKETLVSLKTGKYFQKCSASSELPNYKCEDGFKNKNRDEESGMWATNNDGIGAWIHIFFKTSVKLTKFTYKNRKNPTERNSKLELTYSSGEQQEIALKNTDELVEIHIDAIRTRDVKISIKDVFGTLNNGGSFDFYGIPCRDSDQVDQVDQELAEKSEFLLTSKHLAPLFKPLKDKPIVLGCRESLSNSYGFDNFKLLPDEKIVIICYDSCILDDSPIFGSDIYTKDSAICKAAYHAKKITTQGGKVLLAFN